MKVCFSSFTCPQWSLSQVLHTAHDFGYHGVELRCDAHHQHGVEINTSGEQRQVMKETFHTHGVEPVCLSTSVQAAHPHTYDILTSRIDLAADLEFKAVRVLCGRNEYDHSLVDAIEAAVTMLTRAATYAQQHDVDLWVETYGSIAKASDAASLVRQIEHERVGLLYNTLHPYRMGESVAESFEAMGSLIRYVHFYDGRKDPKQLIVTPMGQGDLPLDAIFIELLRTGYDGYICGSWFHEQYGHTSDESLTRYLKEFRQLAQRHSVNIEQVI